MDQGLLSPRTSSSTCEKPPSARLGWQHADLGHPPSPRRGQGAGHTPGRLHLLGRLQEPSGFVEDDTAGDCPCGLQDAPGDGGVAAPARGQLCAGKLGFPASLVIVTMFHRVRGKKEKATGQILPGSGRGGSRRALRIARCGPHWAAWDGPNTLAPRHGQEHEVPARRSETAADSGHKG